MIETLEDQVDLFDQDAWSGKTSSEPLVQTKEKTSAPSSRKRSTSSTRMPLFLNLRKKDGTNQEPSWETDGASLGDVMTASSTEFLKEENGFVSLRILTETQHQEYSLILNCGEYPKIPNPTKLSQILEKNPDPKYNLSAKACRGILNRAEKRGKALPKELEKALMSQVTDPSVSKNEQESQGGGKGILIQDEHVGALSTLNNQSVFSIEGNGARPSHKGSGVSDEGDPSFTLNSTEQHGVAIAYGIEPGAAQRMNPENRISEELSPTLRSNMGDNQASVAYGISSYDSNAMKSPNPYSGIYEADTARTLDLNGGSPACNQGGMAIVQTASFDHGQGSDAYSLGYAVELAGTVEAGKTKSVLTAVGVDAYNQTTTGDVSMAMTAERSDPQHIPCVCMDVFHLDSDEETALTLMQRDYKDPHVVLEAKTVMGEDITPTFVSQMSTPVGNTQDKMNVVTYQEISGSHKAAGYDKLGTQEASNDMYVTPNSVVRRLTPTEAERLQGFPDGWTDIGDWEDTQGKKHKTSDSNRYKALGNSIATPWWFWLLRRISAEYERPATLGSLFDGIGGFPYCWERCNGKGTAIWASEIEEFPIAVTKIHFPEKEEESNV